MSKKSVGIVYLLLLEPQKNRGKEKGERRKEKDER